MSEHKTIEQCDDMRSTTMEHITEARTILDGLEQSIETAYKAYRVAGLSPARGQLTAGDQRSVELLLLDVIADRIAHADQTANKAISAMRSVRIP